MLHETWSENADYALALLQLIETTHPRGRAMAPGVWDGAADVMRAYAWRLVEWRATRFVRNMGHELEGTDVALFARALLLALPCAPPPPPPAPTWPHAGARVYPEQGAAAAPAEVDLDDDTFMYGEHDDVEVADCVDEAGAVRRGELLHAALQQTAVVVRRQLEVLRAGRPAPPGKAIGTFDLDPVPALIAPERHRPRWHSPLTLTPLLAAALAEALAGHAAGEAGDDGRARFGLMHVASVDYTWPEAPVGDDAGLEVAPPAASARQGRQEVGAAEAWHERLWHSLRATQSSAQLDASKGVGHDAEAQRHAGAAQQSLPPGRKAAIAEVLDLLIAVGVVHAKGVGAPCDAEWSKYKAADMTEGVGQSDNVKMWRGVCAIESWQGQRQQWEFRWLAMLEATCTAAGRDAAPLRAALHARLESHVKGKLKRQAARAEAAAAPPALEREDLPWEKAPAAPM